MLYFLLSTLVLTLYIDVVLSLSIRLYFLWIQFKFSLTLLIICPSTNKKRSNCGDQLHALVLVLTTQHQADASATDVLVLPARLTLITVGIKNGQFSIYGKVYNTYWIHQLFVMNEGVVYTMMTTYEHNFMGVRLSLMFNLASASSRFSYTIYITACSVRTLCAIKQERSVAVM